MEKEREARERERERREEIGRGGKEIEMQVERQEIYETAREETERRVPEVHPKGRPWQHLHLVTHHGHLV